jgi:two-component system LytT family sensor kinase
MKTKLLRLALITSPILALYGVAPIYIFVFKSLDFLLFLTATAFLGVIIFLFWLVNIYLVLHIQKTYQRYLFSYSCTIVPFYLLIVCLTYFLVAPKLPQTINFNEFHLTVYRLISISAINTIILVIINSVSLQYQKENAELEVKNLKVSNLEAQKQALLQQLQPHFLFNALSTLKSLIGENAEEAENYLLKLSEFLRYSVQAHQQDLVSLADELRFTQDYLSLQQVRFGEALQCSIELPEAVLSKKIPVYALQTLVENAIKHNAFTNKKPLLIQMSYANNLLTVSNNKLPKQLQTPSGTGLENLNRRYQLIMNQAIVINNEEDKFIVSLGVL